MAASSFTRIALVGCGDISARHVEALEKHASRAQFTVYCDTDATRAAAIAALAAGHTARITTDFDAVLADADVDAVDLCLPHHLHAPFAIAAARAGKHILCEKPLAVSVEDCDAMIAAADAAGVTLCHGEPMRCAGIVARAAQIVAEGQIGRIAGLQATFAYWQRAELNTGWRGRKSESGGGHLMDGGIHIIDALRHVGGDVASVQAMTAHYRPELGEDSEDLAVLNLRFTAGHCGQLFACHATRGRAASPMMTVFGEEGCLSLEAYGPGNGLVVFLPGQPPRVENPEHGWVDGYERLMGSFLDTVQTGVPLLSTPQDGRENVRLVLAAYRSAETGAETVLSAGS